MVVPPPAVPPIAFATVSGREPRVAGERLALRDRLALDAGLVERLHDERRGALGVDDVGGEEHLHLPGDLVRRLLGLRRRGPGRR